MPIVAQEAEAVRVAEVDKDEEDETNVWRVVEEMWKQCGSNESGDNNFEY